MTDRERYDELSAQLDMLYDSCAKQYAEMLKNKRFDPNSSRGSKKVDKLTRKFADYMKPIMEELNMLADRLNEKAEGQEEKKTLDVSRIEEIEKNLKNRENR